MQIALSSRVYGYHASSRDELDSFLLFIANAKLRVSCFVLVVVVASERKSYYLSSKLLFVVC